jgi:cytochrome P450
MSTRKSETVVSRGGEGKGGLPLYRGHWLFGSFPEYRSDPLGFYLDVWREMGDYCRIRMTPTKSFTLLAHPDAVEHVLLKRQDNYRKPPERNLLFEGSLLMSDERQAREKRKLIQPSYRKSRSEMACAIVLDSTRQFLDRVGSLPDSSVDIHGEMIRLSLQIASMVLFSRDLSEPEEQVDADVSECIQFMNLFGDGRFSLARLPFSKSRRSFGTAKAKLHTLLAEIIREHHDADTLRVDVLSEIMARDSENLFNPVENAFLLLLASYLTMSQVMQFALRKLAEFPEIQERAHREIETILAGREPGPEDLDHFDFVSAVFEESMRLFPNFNLFYHARKDDEINGHPIPAGSRICLSSYVTHRHPDFWDRPMEFSPDRFLASDVPRHKYSYFPFGGGPRICLGMPFALVEGPLILIPVLQKWRIELPRDPNDTRLQFYQRESDS